MKGKVQPNMKICWKLTHPQAIRDVYEFLSSSEQIWRNLALHHFLRMWMGAVRVQTADKNITSNPHLSSPSINIRWSEKLHVFKKQIHHKDDLTLNHLLFGLSFWRHPFTVEDPLVSKWRNAKFLCIWWRNKHIYMLNGLRASIFWANFWMNYSFK